MKLKYGERRIVDVCLRREDISSRFRQIVLIALEFQQIKWDVIVKLSKLCLDFNVEERKILSTTNYNDGNFEFLVSFYAY